MSELCFLYSGDFSGKPGDGEVNRRVVFASNWDTLFCEWQSRFKLGFINSATITKMFKFENSQYYEQSNVFTYDGSL